MNIKVSESASLEVDLSIGNRPDRTKLLYEGRTVERESGLAQFTGGKDNERHGSRDIKISFSGVMKISK